MSDEAVRHVHLECVPNTFRPRQPHAVRWLDVEADYPLARDFWAFPISPEDWRSFHDEVQQCFAVELSYGMRTERAGSRLLCHWEPECLRRYVAEHVLLHEIGHHVQRRQRLRAGLTAFPGHTASEQIADDYALRWARRGRLRHDAA